VPQSTTVPRALLYCFIHTSALRIYGSFIFMMMMMMMMMMMRRRRRRRRILNCNIL
jgi:hypothetical protein